MRFEWDEEKNRGNVAKHKVSFETAHSVFDDPLALSIRDRVVEGEESRAKREASTCRKPTASAQVKSAP